MTAGRKKVSYQNPIGFSGDLLYDHCVELRIQYILLKHILPFYFYPFYFLFLVHCPFSRSIKKVDMSSVILPDGLSCCNDKVPTPLKLGCTNETLMTKKFHSDPSNMIARAGATCR